MARVVIDWINEHGEKVTWFATGVLIVFVLSTSFFIFRDIAVQSQKDRLEMCARLRPLAAEGNELAQIEVAKECHED